MHARCVRIYIIFYGLLRHGRVPSTGAVRSVRGIGRCCYSAPRAVVGVRKITGRYARETARCPITAAWPRMRGVRLRHCRRRRRHQSLLLQPTASTPSLSPSAKTARSAFNPPSRGKTRPRYLARGRSVGQSVSQSANAIGLSFFRVLNSNRIVIVVLHIA